MPRDITVEQLATRMQLCGDLDATWIATGSAKNPDIIAWVFGAGNGLGELIQILIMKIAFSGASGRMSVETAPRASRADMVSSFESGVILGYYMSFHQLATNYGFDTSYMQMRWWNNGKPSYAACSSVCLIANAAAMPPSQLK